MTLFTQEKRHIRLSTALGKDVLLVEALQGCEAMSRPFNFELSLLSENEAIPFEKIIGTGVTVSIDLPSGRKRFLNGIVSRFAQANGGDSSGDDTRVSRYRATVVPWFWLLSRSARSRIYQHLSVPEIAEKIFREHGLSEFQLKLQGSYQRREFCVQYRETDANFISRLLEDEGIHYFFEHGDGRHRMVLADAPEANLPCPGQESASYQIRHPGNQGEDFISSLEKAQELRPAKYSLNDFNFLIPNSTLRVELPSRFHLGSGEREIYDYPCGFGSKSEGERLARIRMEEEEARITTIGGSSNCRAFSSGYRFTLKNYHGREMNEKEFVLTSVEHHASHSVQAGGEFSYGNRFSCMPFDIPFRPARVTPKPLVQGSQTAMVVGPAGDEIYVDEHGRVKVQFHWDREGKKDDNSSCWIRVSQLWTGAGWGAISIPRIGQEVIVDFLEGDPDRPIITGRLYNGISKTPYPLPAEKTKTSLKSGSSPEGGGFNEIRFEDKKGSEQLFIHAEKRQDVRVKGDSLEWVGGERHLMVGGDQLEKVGGDQHLTVIGDRNERIDGTLSQGIGEGLQQKVGLRHALDAGEEIHLKAGVKVVIEAGLRISLRVGGNFVDIGPDGVTIDGTMVRINSGGSAVAGSGASPEAVKSPREADMDAAGEPPKPPPGPTAVGPRAAALKRAAEAGAPFCDT